MAAVSGRRLLLAAEAAAGGRGCRGAWLGTFDFQSRGFYERLGYTVFAELRDFPIGHTHYHLRKVFDAATPRSQEVDVSGGHRTSSAPTSA